ncbi:MAG: cytochrome d ubiquinol oxidase subunit II [Acidimicrobiales bacterium]
MAPFADLNTAWFALIGLLWAGYLFLEGFDFGVAVVAPLVSADETDRRICLNAIGPVWDGNEVWLITAGGATFAAFPLWYARLFSGFYLALFLILVALIARGVSFEFRGKQDSPAWRRAWDWVNFVGSLVPALVWGVAFTDFAHGVPLSEGGRYFGGLPGLLHPVAVLGGLASLALFSLHGLAFLSLKTTGELAARARRLAVPVGSAATALLAGTLAWVALSGRPDVAGSLPAGVPLALGIAAVVASCLAIVSVTRGHDGTAFMATGFAVLAALGAVFARMFPAVLPASNRAANSLTIAATASQHNTLIVMTVVAACFTPFVLAYQGWTYWVFRQRLTRPPAGLGAPGGTSPRPHAGPAAATAAPKGA